MLWWQSGSERSDVEHVRNSIPLSFARSFANLLSYYATVQRVARAEPENAFAESCATTEHIGYWREYWRTIILLRPNILCQIEQDKYLINGVPYGQESQSCMSVFFSRHSTNISTFDTPEKEACNITTYPLSARFQERLIWQVWQSDVSPLPIRHPSSKTWQ